MMPDKSRAKYLPDVSTPAGRLRFACPYGDDLKKWREELKIGSSQWSRYMNGHALPSLETYMQIAKGRDLTLDWLIFGTGLPRGGIDIDRFKRAVKSTLTIFMEALRRGEPVIDNQIVDTFLSHYEKEMDAEVEYVKTYGVKKDLSLEPVNDPTPLSDSERKTLR